MQQLLELLTPSLALILGLAFFKRFNSFYKVLLYQVFAYVIIDCAAIIVQLLGYDNNNWLFNIVMPIEVGFLLLMVYKYFSSLISQRILLFLYSVFLFVFLIDITLVNGIQFLANYAACLEGGIISGVCIGILYSHFLLKRNNRIDYGIVIASIGMLLYFAGTIPFLGMIIYMQRNNITDADNIFTIIIIPLGSLRYLLITVSFLITGVSKKQSPFTLTN